MSALLDFDRRPEWQREAACRGASLDFFANDDVEACQALCASCAVALDCYADAIARGATAGIWGGVRLPLVPERTHCARGHLWAPENLTLLSGKAQWKCRLCISEDAANYRATHAVGAPAERPPALTPAERNARRRAAYVATPKVPPTHCKHGHPYDEENTLILARGERVCRACNRARQNKITQPTGATP